jgi:murein DD-endopeptidase MepM/ murein hydrolase activator NlpD
MGGGGPMRVLKWSAALALFVATALVIWMWSHDAPLPNIRVEGEAIARDAPLLDQLRARAARWAAVVIDIHTGPHLTRASRGALGGALPVEPMAERVRELGRSGQPLADLAALVESFTGGHDLVWPAQLDRIRLGTYVQAIRHNVERAPVAGATDGQGWSIEGVAGLTLDTVSTVAALERAILHGGTRVDVPLRVVPPPQAVAIGSPDAVLYDEERDALDEQDAGERGALSASLSRHHPEAWAPSRGDECDMDPPYSRFCQGPRRVPLPRGRAAERAKELGLGDTSTVGRLLRAGPLPRWVEAAGSGAPTPPSLLWPVPDGRLWRGFGYVRRKELRHKLHRGVDIGAPRGTALLAVNDGIVAYSDNGIRGYGNLLVLVHGDGSTSLYAHCRAVYVFAGQRVRRRQVVGEVGDTGIARGAHLHFEYHVGGNPLDPGDRFVKPGTD